MIVRCDFVRVVTRRYERRDMAAAIAALPCTTACSPYTMTFPGADTIKAGASGEECFLCIGILFRSGVVVGFVLKLLELVVVEGEGVVDASELSRSSAMVTVAVGRTERGRSGRSVDIARE